MTIDWTTSKTIAPPKTITIRYQTEAGTDGTFTFSTIDESETRNEYRSLGYADEQGKRQSSDVLITKIETKTTAAAGVNEALIANRLSLGLATVGGTNTTTTTTTYEYKTSRSGPVLLKERAETRISELELAGGLAVPSYEFYVPSLSQFLAVVREQTYETSKVTGGRELTKTVTRTWIANGLRQEGQQSFAEQMNQGDEDNSAFIAACVEMMKTLVFEGAEIQINVGRASVPQKPSQQSIVRNESSNGDDFARFVRGVVQFQGVPYDSSDDTQTVTYDMPYAPDDVFAYVSGTRQRVPGNSEERAKEFGLTQALLEIGHAFGQNIVTGFGELPTLDLAPLYVRIAGIEGAFLLDAPTYAWDSSGLVASADLMLLGCTGYYGASAPASSWLRLPVPSTGLAAAGTPSVGTAAKANSIAIPNGFNPADPASVAAALAALPTNGSDTYGSSQSGATLIGPVLQVDLLETATGPALTVVEYEYALVLPAESFAVATGAVVVEVEGVIVPALRVITTALPPTVDP